MISIENAVYKQWTIQPTDPTRTPSEPTFLQNKPLHTSADRAPRVRRLGDAGSQRAQRSGIQRARGPGIRDKGIGGCWREIWFRLLLLRILQNPLTGIETKLNNYAGLLGCWITPLLLHRFAGVRSYNASLLLGYIVALLPG